MQQGGVRLWLTRLPMAMQAPAQTGGERLAAAAERRRSRRRAWIRDMLAAAGVDATAASMQGCAAAGGGRRWAAWSSAGEQVVLALGDRPVAVDIETIRTVGADLVDRFAPSLDPDPSCFWQDWTCKEAVLKLLRAGLRIDPARVRLDDKDDGIVSLDGRRLPVRCERVAAPDGYSAALASWNDRPLRA